MKTNFIVYAALLVFAAACAATTEPPEQGQTHWLDACESSADCGELQCACGVCVAPCTEDATCSVDGLQTQCFAAGSAAVEAMCAPSDAIALCLEPCSEGCGEGEACEGGACVVRAPQVVGGEGGAGGSEPRQDAGGGAGGSVADDDAISVSGAGGVGGMQPVDAGEVDARIPIPEFAPNELAITIENTLATPIVIETHDCNGEQGWYKLRAFGDLVRGYTSCSCKSLQTYGECLGSLGVCDRSEYETVEPGQSYTYAWDGGYWRDEPGFSCQTYVEFPRDEPIEAELCWHEAVPTPEDSSAGRQCRPYSFTLVDHGSGITLQATP